MTSMTHPTDRRPLLRILAALVPALLLGALAVQYSRTSWPFVARQAHVHSGAAASPPSVEDAHAAHERPGTPGSRPAGHASVTIDPARIAALQLSTAAVEDHDFTRVVRSVGLVSLDETRSAHVHSKVRGWIDGIHVDFVGRKVAAGEPLCSIYSQDVYSAEMEFLSLLERSSGPEASGALLAAARRRLSLWDVPQSEIDRLEASRKPRRTFPLLAPRAGVVVAKEAIEGMYVEPSVELYTLSDLSRVWVQVDVYLADVPYVHVGDRALLTIEGEPAPLPARVAFLAPTLDEATRTRKVRFELENQQGRLLPGAFASVELSLSMGRGLAIPESAVIRTGARFIVFTAHGEPPTHFEPREVNLGPLAGGYYRVQAGLAAGERVATGAQFLLDSESQLRATSAPGSGHVH